MDEEEVQQECDPGLPAWLATFADLMSLLLCFFVLLLSFSEMDAQKFKQVAGEMKRAFGIQRQIKADEMPKADSIIKTQYTPGKPEPTVLEKIQQRSEVESRDIKDPVKSLLDSIEPQVQKGIVETFVDKTGVTIRINEKGSFSSGSAQLKPTFIPILKAIVTVLNETEGKITVSGHTDNVPISTSQYPSNWLLSAGRSASVVHELTKQGLKDPGRAEIKAHSEYRPIADNDTPENRQMNRRVEIRVEATEENNQQINTDLSNLIKQHNAKN